jgi:hypothetical protein
MKISDSLEVEDTLVMHDASLVQEHADLPRSTGTIVMGFQVDKNERAYVEGDPRAVYVSQQVARLKVVETQRRLRSLRPPSASPASFL